LIDNALKEHNQVIAINGLKGLIKVTQKSGLGLAKGIYLLKKIWKEFDLEENFEDAAYIELGVHKHTVDRYVDVWAMYATNSVPKEYVDRLQQHNIKTQIPIANAIAQGYEIKEPEWGKLADATDFSEVSTIIREDVKGKEPRKG